MNKLKTAKVISDITNPPILCIPLFLIMCIVLSFENGEFNMSKFIVLELISLVFSSILPMAIILSWAKKIGTDKDISNRTDRFVPLIVGITSYFIGFLVSYFIGLSNFLTILLLCYAVNTFIVMIITFKWKISVHTTGLSGPVGALILLLGPFGAIFGILYPILIWSRVLLKKHTLAQAICGAAQGFFLTMQSLLHQ
ncbi:PAP2 family protein [uncultured Methanobrevibacter sp.]|uniref:PAP2 family protein n=1 Tax=uncultured Methanobrevibacter sp. TaxID=253161 RepID=UPI0025E8CEF5|nr:PAP2 family protein [uncultured Methanobrevibacter sp.]